MVHPKRLNLSYSAISTSYIATLAICQAQPDLTLLLEK
jgi:hypothetical protein